MHKHTDFDSFLETNRRLVFKVAFNLKKCRLRHLEIEEIQSIVEYALWRAYEARQKHILELGQPKGCLGHYLQYWIRYALHNVYSDLSTLSPSRAVEAVFYPATKDKELVQSALTILTDQERQFINLRYFEQKPIVECAVSLGVTPAQTGSIHKSALAKMKSFLEA